MVSVFVLSSHMASVDGYALMCNFLQSVIISSITVNGSFSTFLGGGNNNHTIIASVFYLAWSHSQSLVTECSLLM